MRHTVIGLLVGLVLGLLTALLIHVVQPPCAGTAPHCVPPPGGAGLYAWVGGVSALIGACCGAAWHHERLRRRSS